MFRVSCDAVICVYEVAIPGIRKDFYLANSSAACQTFLFSSSGAPYERYSSFRVVSAEGRIVTTDGGSGGLLLVRFPIGGDMQVNTASVVIKTFSAHKLGISTRQPSTWLRMVSLPTLRLTRMAALAGSFGREPSTTLMRAPTQYQHAH